MRSNSSLDSLVSTLPNDVRISTPADLSLMTPFVLLEQGDWFEHEIRWMRRMLRPGMRVLDIGANYGTYSLSAARAVGPEGMVWAVEPTPSVLEHLKESRSLNAFDQLEILPYALGAANGDVSFYTNENAETNALERPKTFLEEIRVPCRTLDTLAFEHGITDLDFVKLDAEGQELAIVEGGSAIFKAQSPVVLFEIMHGKTLHLECWQALKARGYESYALCPLASVLIPVDPEGFDGKLPLNLLACKPDRAAQLEALQLLCRSPQTSATAQKEPAPQAYKKWLQTFSYGQEQARLGLLDLSLTHPGAVDYERALDWHSLALDQATPPVDRLRLSLKAFDHIRAACGKSATVPRMISYIRLANEIHRQDLAEHLLIQLTEAIRAEEQLDIDEPFLSPSPDYDAIDAHERLGAFIQSSIVFQKIQMVGYSSCFSFNQAIEDLKLHQKQGILHPATTRRAHAILARHQATNQPSS